ncbi:zinc-dependent alcohol dehydrogenase [Phytoactinopolyspora halotolerans]|uniref:Alcohol dehydrogenase catalytic domain-containing protein n=1 Tax=Phytoactinopolyspora halotolerans TaxID=1981512 RepID=A0A6L9SH21_9ACTN|nr:alcohol dehydrogenase catalytic domain-containing protein [Phytoactinopolyspora halotolerans]
MKRLHYEGQGAVVLEEVPTPVPGPGEALVRIEASAVCGSERQALLAGHRSNGGHEACGVVAEPASSTFSVGDRVGLAAVIGCGFCERCRAGREIHCRGISGVEGGWHAEYAVVPERALRRVPKGLGPEIGVLLTGDGLGVPARAFRRVPSNEGDRVLVIGLGPIGLGHAMLRAFLGAEVVAIEPHQYRRELANALGATRVIGPGGEIGDAPMIVVECSGRPDCVRLAFDLVDYGGTVIESAGCDVDVPLNPSKMIVDREITYTGSFYYSSEDFAYMCELVSNGLALESLCSHLVKPHEAEGAIRDFLDGNSGKVIITWP